MALTAGEAGNGCLGRGNNVVKVLWCLYNYALKYLLSIGDLFGYCMLKVPILVLSLLFHCVTFLHKAFIHFV